MRGSAEEISDSRPPLDGVTVLDLGQIYNGPYCSLLLAQLGAHVIKIEPLEGEHTRRRSPAGEPYPLIMLSSNKKGLSLDLKNPRGRELFIDLVRTADVVVENFSRGAMDRLGCGYDTLAQANPRLVMAAARGYSGQGPWASAPAMDLAVQAMSGVMSATGFPDGPPVKSGGALCDIIGGVTLALAVVSCLFERERSGRGQFVEVPMLDATLPTLTSPLAGFFESGGNLPERTGNRHGGLAVAPYNVYRCQDGWLAIFCAREPHWQQLARTLGHPELAEDPRYASMPLRAARMEEVDGLVTAWTSPRTRAEAAETLIAEGIPCAPVRGITEIIEDASLRESGALAEIMHPALGPVRVFGSPFRLSRSAGVPLTPAPTLGQHTREVLRDELGLSAEEIDSLLRERVIA